MTIMVRPAAAALLLVCLAATAPLATLPLDDTLEIVRRYGATRR